MGNSAVSKHKADVKGNLAVARVTFFLGKFFVQCVQDVAHGLLLTLAVSLFVCPVHGRFRECHPGLSSGSEDRSVICTGLLQCC